MSRVISHLEPRAKVSFITRGPVNAFAWGDLRVVRILSHGGSHGSHAFPIERILLGAPISKRGLLSRREREIERGEQQSMKE